MPTEMKTWTITCGVGYGNGIASSMVFFHLKKSPRNYTSLCIKAIDNLTPVSGAITIFIQINCGALCEKCFNDPKDTVQDRKSTDRGINQAEQATVTI